MIRSTVLAALKRHSMIEPGSRLCVALSGGPDSTALLHILHSLKGELGIDLCACHVNHRLRGEESEEDARFAREIAVRLSVPFYVTNVDVRKYRRLTGGSIQSAARELRYLVFTRLLSKKTADKIATAHTAGDNTETILMNFLRGAGPQGMAGIPVMRDKNFIRPLLDVQKEEIFRYLEERGIAYRTDPSNDDPAYRRNVIRNSLIPLLEKNFNPSLHKTLQRAASVFGDIQEYLDGLAEKALKEVCIAPKGGTVDSLDTCRFSSLPKALQCEVIKKFIVRVRKNVAALSFENLESLRRLAAKRGGGGDIILPGVRACVSHGKFYCVKTAFPTVDEFLYKRLDEGFVFIKELGCRVNMEKIKPPPPPFDPACETVYMNLESVPENSVFRNRRNGDKFHPLGGPGTRKLKSFFIDKKIPRWERDSILLLAAGPDVLWIAGYGLAESVAVSKNAEKNILKVKIEQPYLPEPG
ncbi:MAG: tRNA(Ile)-lysidine synthase [bacterium]|nr:MAG: tRNA(Ile)-lysidine synthase [bacterium]